MEDRVWGRIAGRLHLPNADGGILDVGNYRFRVLKPLADALGIEQLNFQILRQRWRPKRRTWVRSSISKRTSGMHGSI